MQVLWEKDFIHFFSHCILGACESRGHTIGIRVHKWMHKVYRKYSLIFTEYLTHGNEAELIKNNTV